MFQLLAGSSQSRFAPSSVANPIRKRLRNERKATRAAHRWGDGGGGGARGGGGGGRVGRFNIIDFYTTTPLTKTNVFPLLGQAHVKIRYEVNKKQKFMVLYTGFMEEYKVLQQVHFLTKKQ